MGFSVNPDTMQRTITVYLSVGLFRNKFLKKLNMYNIRFIANSEPKRILPVPSYMFKNLNKYFSCTSFYKPGDGDS